MTYNGRLKKSEWEVRSIALTTAQQITKQYHYAKGGSNTGTYTHGLFRRDEFWEANCAGIAWWIPPTKSSAIATYPANWRGVLCLSRLVIVPGVPLNACSFLLARSVKMIDRERWPCLVTYADEWQGHTGTIYRAANWSYMGLTKPETVFVVNGRMTSRKAGPITRTHSEMLALGAEELGRFAKHKFVNIREFPANKSLQPTSKTGG